MMIKRVEVVGIQILVPWNRLFCKRGVILSNGSRQNV